GKLKALVPIYEEHAVDNDLLVEGTRNIRDYLQSKGYFEAQVEFKPQRVVNDEANIDYLINQGKRHRLVAITVRGNEYFRTAVLFRVKEGPQYFVNKVQVDGVASLDRETLLRSLSSAEGQPFSEFNVAVDRDTIQTKYFESGFPEATFDWSFKPAEQKYRIDV